MVNVGIYCVDLLGFYVTFWVCFIVFCYCKDSDGNVWINLSGLWTWTTVLSVAVAATAPVRAGTGWFLSCLTFFIKHYELNENADANTSNPPAQILTPLLLCGRVSTRATWGCPYWCSFMLIAAHKWWSVQVKYWVTGPFILFIFWILSSVSITIHSLVYFFVSAFMIKNLKR